MSLFPPTTEMPPAFRTVAQAVADAPQGSFNHRVAQATWRALLTARGDLDAARAHVEARPDLTPRWRTAIHRLLDRADTTDHHTTEDHL